MKLLKAISIYTSTGFLNKGIAFFLVPVFTYYLSPEDYGILALFTIYLAAIYPLMHLGSHGSINLEYFNREKKDYKSYLSSALAAPTVMFIFFLALTFCFEYYLSQWLEVPGKWLYAIPVIAYGMIYRDVLLRLFRNREKPLQYTILSVSRVVVELSVSLTLVVYLSMNWQGRVIGLMSTAVGLGLISFFILWRKGYFEFKIKKEYVYLALAFGLPLIPYQISKFVVSFSDRIFIAKMVPDGVAETGIYNIGYQVGALITILNAGFSTAFTPYIYRNLKSITPKKELTIVRVTYIYVAVLMALLIAISLAAPYFFKHIVNERFSDGVIYVFWVGLGFVFWATYMIFGAFIYFYKKTKLLGYLAIINIIINLVLNYFLIKEYGPIGAAYATCISYLCVLIGIIILVNRIHKLPWLRYRRILNLR